MRHSVTPTPSQRKTIQVSVLCAVFWFHLWLSAADPEITRGIEFAKIGETTLRLDLYRPAVKADPHLIVWVHGGAWRRGSRSSMPLTRLMDDGYAIASIDYRLTPIAPFPAQVHDIKAAIRYLRAHSDSLGIQTRSIAIAGASAGGHLVALVGTTNGHPALEGRVGDHLDQSSAVQAVISYYGASNLSTILKQSTPIGLNKRVPALELLLEGQPDENIELAKLASPVEHVDQHDPPLLLIHGDQDLQMPINQSHELEGVYRAQARPVHFEVVHGGGHGGKAFHDDRRTKMVLRFLQSALSFDSESASLNRTR